MDLHNATFPSYPVPLNVSLDPNVSTWIVDYLDGLKKNVSALRAWGDSEPIGLRWGEVRYILSFSYTPLTYTLSLLSHAYTAFSPLSRIHPSHIHHIFSFSD